MLSSFFSGGVNKFDAICKYETREAVLESGDQSVQKMESQKRSYNIFQ
jgi:hypothetical protein